MKYVNNSDLKDTGIASLIYVQAHSENYAIAMTSTSWLIKNIQNS